MFTLFARQLYLKQWEGSAQEESTTAYYCYYYFCPRDHPFSAYAEFSEKLKYLTPCYGVKKCWFFR